MTDGSAGRSSPLALLFLLVGAGILGYAQLILSPPAASAAWTGVLESAAPGEKPGTSFPGSDASRTITLHLQGQSSGRTFSVPTGASLTPEQLKAGDTVRVLVGWGRFREVPAALSLTAAGAALVDSATVLPRMRSQSNRWTLVGGIFLALGVALFLKARRKG